MRGVGQGLMGGEKNGNGDHVAVADPDLAVEKNQLGDQDLVATIQARTRYAIRAVAEWTQEAREDFRFALGDQWTQEELEILDGQKRPALTFNKIEPIINAVAGHQRKNSSRIRINPEGGEDQLFTTMSDKVVSHFDKLSHLKYEMDFQFDDGMIGGRGWLELARDYNDDPIFGKLKVCNLGPWSVFKDPSSKRYDLSDAQFCVKVIKVSRATLKQMFPEKEGLIAALPQDSFDPFGEINLNVGDKDDYRNRTTSQHPEVAVLAEANPENPDDQTFHLIEYWYRKWITKFFIYHPLDGRVLEFEKKEEADEKATQLKQELTLVDQRAAAALGVYKRKLSQMCVASLVGEILIQPSEVSPLEPRWHDFPFFQFIAWYTPSAETELLRVKGMTRGLKDVQRHHNKSRSQLLHIVNTTANSGWIGDEDALSPQMEQELKAAGSKPGVLVKIRTGKRWERIESAAPPTIFQFFEKWETDDFKEISGINADLLSVQDSGAPSGKALGIRISQALTIVAKPFTNWQFTKELVGNCLVSLIPDMVDSPRLRKILGEQFIQENKLEDGMLQAYLVQIEDRKYNVWVSEADNSPTIRAETFEQLIELAKSGADIPIEIILEFSSIPDVQGLLKKLEAYRAQQMALAQAVQAPGRPQTPAG